MINQILGPLIKEGSKMIDKLTLTKEEKEEFKLKFAGLANEQERQIQETIRQKDKSTAQIITAEVQQDDKYTKRARPTVIYVGILLIIWAYAVIPVLNNQFDWEIAHEIPNFFWQAWAAIVSVYAGGRSLEKWKKSGDKNDGAVG